jgi:hypothetical protein
MIKKTISKVWHWLQLWDGVWSIPLAIFSFIAFGIAGSAFFGAGFGFYSPELFQAAIYVAALMVIFNFSIWLGIYFNFRKVFYYYLFESKADFKTLSSWQKISLLLFLYCFFFVVQVILFSKIV